MRCMSRCRTVKTWSVDAEGMKTSKIATAGRPWPDWKVIPRAWARKARGAHVTEWQLQNSKIDCCIPHPRTKAHQYRPGRRSQFKGHWIPAFVCKSISCRPDLDMKNEITAPRSGGHCGATLAGLGAQLSSPLSTAMRCVHPDLIAV